MKFKIIFNIKYFVLILIGFTFSCNQQTGQKMNTYKNELIKEQTEKINKLLETKENILGNYSDNYSANDKNYNSYTIKNLNINTVDDDFSPSIIYTEKDEFNTIGIVYASAGGFNSNSLKYQRKNNNRPLIDLYYSYLMQDQTFSKRKLLEDSFLWKLEDPRLNTEFHDGVVTFTNNGSKMYLTQNNDSVSSQDTLNLVIISFSEIDGRWKKDDESEFEYNNPEYNCAHPTISSDGNRLYFSSDMPNGLGGMDLYVRNKLSDGSWGVAKNLGPGINTEGNEIFPFINTDNALYFASDGHKGLGGLDVFKAVYDSKGKWNLPKNMGKPINSSSDDFGITFYTQGDSGYFCSNKPGGVGKDDIYFFKGTSSSNKLEILVIDSISKNPLDSVLVKISTCNDGIETGITDVEGKFTKLIKAKLICEISVIKDEYVPKLFKFKRKELRDGEPLKDTIRLQKKTFVKGDIIELPEIYYDLDKATLRYESKKALDELIQTLEDHPNITIKLISHTDSRQTHAYNKDLSNRRAKSVVDYLINHNVSPDRLTWEGRGETDLRVSDKEIEKLPTEFLKEEAHQRNRRTEFEVLSTNYVPR